MLGGRFGSRGSVEVNVDGNSVGDGEAGHPIGSPPLTKAKYSLSRYQFSESSQLMGFRKHICCELDTEML